MTLDDSNALSSSEQVTGKAYAADHAPPTPSNLLAAIGDMQTAFADAAGRSPDASEFGGGILGDRVLGPGVYRWGANVLIPTSVTLGRRASINGRLLAQTSVEIDRSTVIGPSP